MQLPTTTTTTTHLLLLSLLTLTATTNCTPITPWPSPIRSYFTAVSSRIADLRSTPTLPSPPSCSLSSATLPSSSLPPPSPGLVPYHIAIGRGTQNYTCTPSNPSAAPVNIGALATLYNASCLAAINPFMLSLLPAAALSIPTPADGAPLFPAQSVLSGHHYFTETVPTFNLHTAAANYGITFNKKVANVSAPAGSSVDSVAWLKLQTAVPDGDVRVPDQTGAVKEVYRVNTAGGGPPKTCEGMPEQFQVQYAAEYWFFH